jgi:hypothetical protein
MGRLRWRVLSTMSNHVIKHIVDVNQEMTNLISPTHTAQKRKGAKMSRWQRDEEQIGGIINQTLPAKVNTLSSRMEAVQK